jgi:hypothetical protein
VFLRRCGAAGTLHVQDLPSDVHVMRRSEILLSAGPLERRLISNGVRRASAKAIREAGREREKHELDPIAGWG